MGNLRKGIYYLLGDINMLSQKTRLVLALSFMMFLSFAAFAPAFASPVYLTAYGVPTPGTTSYYTEYFNSTTYLGAGATADGWGNGTLTSTRSITGGQLNFTSTPNPVKSVDVQGRKLYATQFHYPAISIYNLTDPTDLELLDDRSATSSAMQGLVVGDVLYIGTADSGSGPWLAAYNVTNPYNIPGPMWSSFIGDGDITDIEVQGHFLYVVCAGGTASNDWQVFDIEDPTNLVQVGALGWGALYGFCVDGHIGYFADGPMGLYVRNVSAPGSTTHMDSYGTPGNCTDVIVDGNIAYVADGPGGVLILNASDPGDLQLLGSYDTSGFARRLVLQGKTLFVADGQGGIVVLDVSDPTHPSHVNVFTTPYAWDIDLYAGDIVVGTDNGILVFEYGGGMDMLTHYASFNSGYEVWDVRVQGDIAYIAAGPDGLVTVDVSNPGAPVVLDNYSIGAGFYHKIDVQGHIAVVTDSVAILTVLFFDISDPENIVLMGALMGGGLIDVFLWGEVCWYTYTNGFGSLNISDPYNPTLINQVNGVGNVTACWVQGYHLYIAVDLNAVGLGFRIYDIRQINSPSLVKSYNIQSYHYDIFVDGDFAYAANGNWFAVWNVTNPFAATYPDTIYDTSNPSTGVWSFGPYILSARGSGGVRLIDTRNVFSATTLATYAPASQATQVTVHGDFAYVANQNTLEIFRIFRSAGATYATGASTATSLTIDSTTEIIYEATITQTAHIPAGTSIAWQLSADGGTNWESVSLGIPHTFNYQGSDLRYRATFTTNRQDLSAHLYNISISYSHSQPPTAPVLNDPGTDAPAGDVTISWSASSDPDGSVDHYVLQSSNTPSFAAILATYPTTATTYNVSAPTSGIFYFRVQAVDNDGVHGPWSNVEDINIVGGLPPPPIPGFPIEAIIIGAVAALGLGAFYRRRKR
jgi:hypothetical protein